MRDEDEIRANERETEMETARGDPETPTVHAGHAKTETAVEAVAPASARPVSPAPTRRRNLHPHLHHPPQTKQ